MHKLAPLDRAWHPATSTFVYVITATIIAFDFLLPGRTPATEAEGITCNQALLTVKRGEISKVVAYCKIDVV